MDDKTIEMLVDKWAKQLRITPTFDVQTRVIHDATWRKTGDLTIDCDDKKAVIMINGQNPRNLNLEEVIVHELFHLKLWPLDQVTESLIESNYDKDTKAYQFAYRQFMTTLEQTVSELAKTYLLKYGDNKTLSFNRSETLPSFDTLYDNVKSLK